MKRLFALLTAIFVFLTASAQVEHSIIIDQSSFCAVQRDALTGANIDPIAKDLSRNACARVKIRFANMNRAEVDALAVKFRSNTDLAKQYVAEYYDNVLILEMTAKQNTRFYVQSPDYGQSNEVTINLEADKEYEMEARLNQTFSIIVGSNVEGAEVYIDGNLKGRTDNTKSCTIKNVIIGSHTLKLVYGNASAQQYIDVNSGRIFFRQDLNVEVECIDVTFNVQPLTAAIVIDNNGIQLPIFNGTFTLKLPKGKHSYVVSADKYCTKSGEIDVTQASKDFNINLDKDANAKYEIGDLVTIDGVQGIVFQTSPIVKMVTVKETLSHWMWTGYEKVTNAISRDDGKANMEKVMSITGWKDTCGAFYWCYKLGEGWYLPAINELIEIWKHKDKLNKVLSVNGMDKLATKNRTLWSSSELNHETSFCVNFSGDIGAGRNYKSLDYAVRAVYVLGQGVPDASDAHATADAQLSNYTDIGGFEMVFVNGGKFTMGATAEQGSDAFGDEKPAHSVALSDFYISKCEVTQAQWYAVMGSYAEYYTDEDRPVEKVSWKDVQKFIKKLNAQTGKNFRLPTEAEWEYAARGGCQSKGYKYSGSDILGDVAWSKHNSKSKTHTVGQKAPNELGIYDMNGNVWEMCQDWYGEYRNSAQSNPKGPNSGSERVLRGGSCGVSAMFCRISKRYKISPDEGHYGVGFRLACSAE